MFVARTLELQGAYLDVGRVSLIICESDAKFKRTRCVEPSISRPRTIFVCLPQITENGLCYLMH